MSGRESGSSSSPGNEGQAAYRQDSDRLVLTNDLLSFAFSADHGAMVSAYHRQSQAELIDAAEASTHGFLWRCQVATSDGASTALTSRSCAEFRHNVSGEQEGGLRLRLEWAGIRAGAAEIEGQITVLVTFSPDSPTAWFEIELRLPDHLSVQAVDFPCVCALGASDPLTTEALFLPVSSGVLVREPRAALAARGPGASWQAIYPGPASMQMLGFSSGDKTTAWLGSGDSSGARKALVAASMPESNRLALWIAQAVVRTGGLWTPGYASSVGVVGGDWFEAAREYRAWAIHQPWCGRGRGGERGLPALTSSYGLWLSHWGDGRHAVAGARELQRLVNVPIKLDWRCWHRCAHGGAYPDYFPPRDGEEAFAEAKRHLAEAGVLAELALNGLLANPESEAWQVEKAESYRVLDPSQEGAARPALTAMCPATRYWREKLSALAREAMRLGAQGVYLEELGNSQPRQCQHAEHGHGPPRPNYWSVGVRMALAEVKGALGSNGQLATDGPTETYMNLVDAFLSPHAAAEREGLFSSQFGSRWWPIPLFSAVYHGYTTLIGPGSSLVNQRPYDPLSSMAAGEMRLPVPLMTRDFQGQFCLETARAAVWGHQLMLAGFSSEQARPDGNRYKLAFLSTLLRAQAWGIGALLPFSEFMGMLSVDSPAIEVDLLVNPVASVPSERRTMRRSLSPILGSAWRPAGSGLALVLVNIHDQAVEFATRLRSTRLEVKLPIQLIGRTFSEDGDVPAAALRASGTEIGGRLPGRSVVLVTLR